MKKLLSTLVAAAVLSAPAAAAPRDPEAELAEALRGRVAGEPVSCIPLRQASSEIIDGTAILYRVGDTIYVNRPRGGAETLRRDDVLVTRTFDSRLCRPEIVTLVDRFSRFQRGFVGLGDFVPYRRAETR
ncbi:hypothetical protein [Sphingomonas lenta]|uniref:Uncharacterized protein n=1 Tax=Sphingomonas lenta TaxID=1141887 RepID=A0A2A2SC12_9SPHN|nr:hypothetical protein [Sphingomonas lenta]PAX06730.1 hypothetical protein CKY28_16530 [Sphingomonas lenta]